MRDYLAKGSFTYFVAPIALSFIAVTVRLLIVATRKAKLSKAQFEQRHGTHARTEAACVWVELMLVATMNLVIRAGDLARVGMDGAHPGNAVKAGDVLLEVMGVAALLLVAMFVGAWVLAMAVRKTTPGKHRRGVVEYLIPHAAAVGVLYAVMVFMARPLP